MVSQLSIDEQIELLRRGAIEIIPEEELRSKLKKSRETGVPLRLKLGLDPTAPDIHLGHAVVLRKLRQFQDLGHEVIIIIGDFTASIGDPSGRTITRPVLSSEEISVNARTYEEQYCSILNKDKTRVTFNSEWLDKVDFAGVIRITGKITVARILERDDFATRLAEGRPIGLHEVLYPVCQAYDSVALKSDIELGGTDQKFNILMGRDLQREFGIEPQIAMFMPILVGLDGVQKMSKSLGNYVGIAEPANEMFGKLMSIPDNLMPQYYELCTDVPMAEVKTIIEDVSSGKMHPMAAKKRLASEIVSIYHDQEAAANAQAEFERVFSSHELPSEIPAIIVSKADLEDGKIWIAKLLTLAGFAASNSEARRLVTQGGVTIDGEKVVDHAAKVVPADGQVLRVGKLKFGKIEIK